MNPFGSICDDSGLFVNLNARLDLPTGSETVLHFFEAIQKSFPEMGAFERRDGGEFVLAEEGEDGNVRSVTLEMKRLTSAHLNSDSLEDADRLHERILHLAPYHLDFSSLNCDSLDVIFMFNYLYNGNHNEVIAEALGQGSPFEGILRLPGSRVTQFEPSMTVTLDDACRLQARLWVESGTNGQQVKMGQYLETPITVYFQLHQEWRGNQFRTFAEAYRDRRRLAFELIESHVIPGILQPLRLTITTR